MKEPTIHELQKLFEHFRKTNREHELKAILDGFGVKPAADEVVNPETGEFNEEGIEISKIQKKEGLRVSYHKPFKYLHHKNTPRFIRYGLYYLGLFLLIFIGLNAPIVAERLSFKPKETATKITTQTVEDPNTEDSAPLDAGEVIPAGSQLVVPKIGVTAPIVYATSQNEKDIQTNLTQGVVHYSGTALPGEVGNSFLTGHSSNFWWIKGNYNYVFLNLDKLVVGDQAKIYYNGKKFVYAVSEVKVVAAEDTSVLAQTDVPTMTLMTCTPPGTNWRRLIVKFNQVAPRYQKPRLVTKEVLATPVNLPSTDSNTGGAISAVWQWIVGLFSTSN